MKKSAAIALLSVLCLASIPIGFALSRIQRIQQKAHVVEAKAKAWASEGKNPALALQLMSQAKRAFDSGNSDIGESAIDVSAPVSNLYANPKRIELSGYDQDAMEPCISLDGKYLLFNNNNERPDMHIFAAKRVAETRFQLLGEVSNIHLVNNPPNGDEREQTPSLDRENNLYYVSPYSYRRDFRTVYAAASA